MVGRISRSELATLTSLTPAQVAEGIRLGFVREDSEKEAEIDYPLYSSVFVSNKKAFDLWKYILVRKAYDKFSDKYDELFKEVSDIAVAFDYPDDVNDLIYFMPSSEDESSPKRLREKIASYVRSHKL
jgi:hypothetical protein